MLARELVGGRLGSREINWEAGRCCGGGSAGWVRVQGGTLLDQSFNNGQLWTISSTFKSVT